MADRVVDGIMKPGRKRHQKSAIRMIEEAVHLLRSAPASLLAAYYLGSVPFVLGLMYFWADMSRSAKAAEHSAMSAVGLAFLYVWLKFWHAVFVEGLRARLAGNPRQRWSPGRIVATVATQSLIQSTRFIVLPVAGAIMIPFGFCYAFYQNVTAHTQEDGQTIRSTCKWAWRQARLWPRQNHLLIVIFWIFGFAILINLSFAAFMIPQMAKSLFGIESIFTLTGLRMILNTTFWIAILGMTYLCLDPLIKTVYVLRCFGGSALKSGEDLKKELNRLRIDAKKLGLGLMLIVLCAAPMAGLAAQSATHSAGDLDRSIEEVLQRREFAWRMPRETVLQEEQEAKGPIGEAIKWLLDEVAKGFRAVGDWIAKVVEWLEDLLPQPDNKPVSPNKNWITPIRAGLILLLVLCLAFLTFVFFRIWRRNRAGSIETAAAAVAPVPDLNDEGIKADDLPVDRWQLLAEEFTAKGELRMAMRALYLATLAHLSEREMITIEIYKSNREYEQELNRRAHERNDLVAIFSSPLDLFERVWYGMHRIQHADFDHFRKNQKRIMTFSRDSTVQAFRGSVVQG